MSLQMVGRSPVMGVPAVSFLSSRIKHAVSAMWALGGMPSYCGHTCRTVSGLTSPESADSRRGGVTPRQPTCVPVRRIAL
jgi:hypothetical protein